MNPEIKEFYRNISSKYIFMISKSKTFLLDVNYTCKILIDNRVFKLILRNICFYIFTKILIYI